MDSDENEQIDDCLLHYQPPSLKFIALIRPDYSRSLRVEGNTLEEEDEMGFKENLNG